MSVAESVWIYLSDKSAIVDLLGKDSENVPYLFQDNLILEQEYLENSQDCAVVISHSGDWDVRSPFSTWIFPRVVIQVWADPARNSDGTPATTTSARDKALEISKQLSRVLHRIGSFDERWGDLRVNASSQLRGPDITPVGDGNGLLIATLYFGLQASE